MSSHFVRIVILALIFLCPLQILATKTASSTEQMDYKILMGKWVRSDAGYTINVRDISSDGLVDAEYLNPKAINIAEAKVSAWKGMSSLQITLQDEGYPGSTYTLYYYAEKDALAGFYYQAAMDETYEVVFLRKQN